MSANTGWNRSRGTASQQTRRDVRGKSSFLRGGLAGLIVVAAIGACIWLMRGGSETKKVENPKPPSMIRDVATNVVAAVKGGSEKPVKPIRLSKKGTPIPDRVQPDEHGVLRYPGGLRWIDTNDLHLVKHPHKRRLFKFTSENQIATMLQLDPTRMAPFLVGRRRPFDQRFVEDFKASFNDTVVIDKEDTPEEAEVRRAVLETKAELKARMDAGEDIAEIMNQAQKELDRLCQYHDELKKQMRETLHNPELTDDDVRDFVTAANMLLEKQGITQFAMPNLAKRQARLLLAKERKAVKEAAERAKRDNQKGE